VKIASLSLLISPGCLIVGGDAPLSRKMGRVHGTNQWGIFVLNVDGLNRAGLSFVVPRALAPGERPWYFLHIHDLNLSLVQVVGLEPAPPSVGSIVSMNNYRRVSLSPSRASDSRSWRSRRGQASAI
jgi:hypothetical protein